MECVAAYRPVLLASPRARLSPLEYGWDPLSVEQRCLKESPTWAGRREVSTVVAETGTTWKRSLLVSAGVGRCGISGTCARSWLSQERRRGMRIAPAWTCPESMTGTSSPSPARMHSTPSCRSHSCTWSWRPWRLPRLPKGRSYAVAVALPASMRHQPTYTPFQLANIPSTETLTPHLAAMPPPSLLKLPGSSAAAGCCRGTCGWKKADSLTQPY